MKKKNRDIRVAIDHYPVTGRVILSTNYQSGSFLFVRVMFEFALSLLNEVSPVDDGRRQDVERKFSVQFDGSGPTSFMLPVSDPEGKSLQSGFSKVGNWRFVRICPSDGTWVEISREEYDLDEHARQARHLSMAPGQPGTVTEGAVHIVG